MTGFEAVRKLFDAARLTIRANCAGLAFTASAILIAMGTISTVEPTCPMDSAATVVINASAICSAMGPTLPTCFATCAAIQPAVPV